MSLIMLINNLFREIGFIEKEKFYCTTNEMSTVSIIPFVSDNYLSQVYLIVEMKEDELRLVLKSDYLAKISSAFMKQDCYQPDMAKNSSLLILNCCKKKDNRKAPEKIEIEDDPLFFKKYVLSYTALEEEKMSEYFMSQEEQRESKLYCRMIQEYLWNSMHFRAYKENYINEPVYTIFSEIATKLPIMPLASTGVQKLKSVDAFLQENLSATKNKRSPVNVNIDILDALLHDIPNWKDVGVDEIDACYNAILGTLDKEDKH